MLAIQLTNKVGTKKGNWVRQVAHKKYHGDMQVGNIDMKVDKP